MINVGHFEVLLGGPARQISYIRPRFSYIFAPLFSPTFHRSSLFSAESTRPCWVIQITGQKIKKDKIKIKKSSAFRIRTHKWNTNVIQIKEGSAARILNVYVTSFANVNREIPYPLSVVDKIILERDGIRVESRKSPREYKVSIFIFFFVWRNEGQKLNCDLQRMRKPTKIIDSFQFFFWIPNNYNILFI